VVSVKVKNVVFDMGGVLLKWEPLLYARRFADNDEDAALLARVVFGSQEWAWADAGAVSCETVAWTAKKRLPERFHGTVDDLVFRWFEKRELIEGMDELIHDLHSYYDGVHILTFRCSQLIDRCYSRRDKPLILQ
jgi:putative hydrolase of the HAD superfamily